LRRSEAEKERGARRKRLESAEKKEKERKSKDKNEGKGVEAREYVRGVSQKESQETKEAKSRI
jgi:hypothetical protein